MNNQTVFVGIDPVAIGNRIATLRESSGYTVSELIEKDGTCRRTYENFKKTIKAGINDKPRSNDLT